jgi:hypothetical protein
LVHEIVSLDAYQCLLWGVDKAQQEYPSFLGFITLLGEEASLTHAVLRS